MIDDPGDVALESATTETFGAPNDLVGRKGDRIKASHGFNHTFGCLRLKEHASHAIDHRIERATGAERDNRPASRLYFNLRDTEVVLGRKDRRLAVREEMTFLLVGDEAEKFDVRAGSALQISLACGYTSVSSHSRSYSLAAAPIACVAFRRCAEMPSSSRHRPKLTTE